MSNKQSNGNVDRQRGELVPRHLAAKLKLIRAHLGLTQGAMLMRINPREVSKSNRARVSQYETGTRNPSLIELKNYAGLLKISADVLLDDQISASDFKALITSRQRHLPGTGQAAGAGEPVAAGLSGGADGCADCTYIAIPNRQLGECRRIFLELIASHPLGTLVDLTYIQVICAMLDAAADIYRQNQAQDREKQSPDNQQQTRDDD